VLVLTRRAGESIVIGDDVRVVVLDVRGDTVRLGIDAPRSVQVHRAEVYAEVQAANAAAVSSSTEDLGSVATRLARMVRPASGTRRPHGAAPAPEATPSSPAGPVPPAQAPAPAPAPVPAPSPAPAVPPTPSPAQDPAPPPPPGPPARPKPGPPPRKA
jgi:carbon storage regulator